LPSTGISGIVVSHANANILYVLTGDGDASGGGFIKAAGYWRSSAGVFVSYDAGINWYPTAPLPITGSYAGYALVQDPNNASILLAATDKGIYRSDNAGGSWSQVLSGRTYEIKYRPGNSNYVYATQNGKFFRSVNGGVDWTQITNFNIALPSGRLALAVTNGQSNRVYVMSGWANGGSTFGGVYISFDYGGTFTRQSNSPNIVESGCDGNGGNNQSSYDLAIGVSHVTTSRIIAAGVSTWRSTTTGTSWLNASAGRCGTSTSSTGYVHADVHDIEYSPLNGHVYVCSDGGLIKSVNHGVDWTNLSDGIAASQIYHMAGSLTNINNMLIGLQDNGTKRRNANSTTWDQVLSADGYDCIYNFNGSTTGYLSWNSAVNRFTSNGGNRTGITPPGSSGFFPRVTSAVDDPTLVLAGYNDIYRSTNSGSSWTNEGVAGNWDLERCPSNVNRFYAAGGSSAFNTTGSMWVSTDKGLNWTTISGNTGYPTANLRLTDICVRPNVSTHVWIVFGGFSDGDKVFYSSNAGGSWTNMSGSLPNVPVNAIAVDNGNNAYIGTDIGVFYRGSGMNDWVPFWHRGPIVPITDLELYQNEGLIRAATFGRGVWQSDTYTSCPATWVLFSNLSGNRYYEVSDWISCNTTIYGGANTQVVFKAADHVTLSPGFQVGAGNKFKAYIKPCGQADLEN
jgi:ligand-binding sensor domain-containing protein